MSEQMNYMQRVGHSRCVRCDFETSDDMTFAQQDAAMRIHLNKRHPDWMGITCSEPSPEPEAAPASDAQATAVPHMTNEMLEVIIDNMTNRYICSQDEARSMARELAQLRARVAILDAQEVKLPELPPSSDDEYNAIARMRPHAPRNTILASVREKQRALQLLDALRAVQAKNELLRIASEEVQERRNLNGLPPLDHIGRWEHKLQLAYDALAGKGE